ncbi:AtpZ/AtpI family protein [Anaeromyxobacter oryzisoli]|uniref:AtpZ/AtpI family protein n=1 Tax=Anaeromyxobacter oryzisoli TaxID=2925408 RepID=UPI001F55FD7D|nr:AtpZ/AtpI family protein [Anaeromyxobacter sp. SG63]
MGPSDRERRAPEEQGLSNLALAHRKAAPYIGAGWSLVASIVVFAGAGYWLDGKMGNRTPWFTLVGSVLGITGGLISFLRLALRTGKK